MKSDFDHWLEYHGRAFVGFNKWVADNADQTDHMRRILGRHTRDQLESATDKLYDQAEQPRGYGSHARAIRAILMDGCSQGFAPAKVWGPVVRNHQLVAGCRRCMDFGLVEVVSPLTLRRLHLDDPSHGVLTCMICCSCDRGAEMQRVHKMPRWEDGHMLIRMEDVMDEFISSHEELWDVAKRLMEALKPRVGPPQFSEFASYAPDAAAGRDEF